MVWFILVIFIEVFFSLSCRIIYTCLIIILSGYLTRAVGIFVVPNYCSLSLVCMYIGSKLYSWIYLNE